MGKLTMKNHFQIPLLLTCIGTLSTGMLLFAPDARAGCDSPRNGTEAFNCSSQSTNQRYQDDKNKSQQWEAEQNRQRTYQQIERNNNNYNSSYRSTPSAPSEPTYTAEEQRQRRVTRQCFADGKGDLNECSCMAEGGTQESCKGAIRILR
jgi:hypothetical protein